MRTTKTTVLLLAAILVSERSPAAADDARSIAYGRHLAQECASCHRPDGIDNGIASIVGWNPETFIETMNFYRSGARANAVMASVLQSLDDEQVRALAGFYATQPKPIRAK